MQPISNLIDEGDWLGLLFVASVAAYVGQAMLHGRPTMTFCGLRIATVGFIAFTVKRAIEYGPPQTSDLASAVVHGLLAAAVILGPAWIVLAIVGFLYEHYRKFTSAARVRAETRRDERSQRRQRRQQQLQERASQQRSPEQEQAEREAAESRQQEAERVVETAKRGEDAIAACELLFHLRAPDIGERFTREQLDEFVTKFMGADKTIEIVERRAGELQALIQQHFEAVSPPLRFTDLAELTAWYEQQKRQIGSLPVTDVYKQDFLVQLNERYAELTQQTLEKL